MPVVGKILAGTFPNTDCARRQLNKLTALADPKKAGIATFAYGNFITVLINFVTGLDHLPMGEGDEQTEEG